MSNPLRSLTSGGNGSRQNSQPCQGKKNVALVKPDLSTPLGGPGDIVRRVYLKFKQEGDFTPYSFPPQNNKRRQQRGTASNSQ